MFLRNWGRKGKKGWVRRLLRWGVIGIWTRGFCREGEVDKKGYF